VWKKTLPTKLCEHSDAPLDDCYSLVHLEKPIASLVGNDEHFHLYNLLLIIYDLDVKMVPQTKN
jgi:hypothetical protein